MELFEGCSTRYMSGVSYNRAINLSSQFPEVALLATASKRIVLPLVLPALAQSLSQATEAADHPSPKKGSSQPPPAAPPYQWAGSHQGGPCKVRGPKERLAVALLRASFAQLFSFSEASGLVRSLLQPARITRCESSCRRK